LSDWFPSRNDFTLSVSDINECNTSTLSGRHFCTYITKPDTISKTYSSFLKSSHAEDIQPLKNISKENVDFNFRELENKATHLNPKEKQNVLEANINPFTGEINVYWDIDNSYKNYSLEIYNLEGQLLEHKTINSKNNILIEAEKYRNHILLFMVRGDNQLLSKKVLLNY
ncbi:MAG: hypothetical protein ABIO44_10120, partial [Saprospiraceae bacterium]